MRYTVRLGIGKNIMNVCSTDCYDEAEEVVQTIKKSGNPNIKEVWIADAFQEILVG